MPSNVQIIFYSAYGHVWRLAEAEAEGARSVPGTNVDIYQVRETLPDDLLKQIGAFEARKQFAHIAIADVKNA